MGEQRRVAALAGRQRLDVVGHLALEEHGRLGALEQQLAAVGAVDQPHALAQTLVLGRRDGHGTDDRNRR